MPETNLKPVHEVKLEGATLHITAGNSKLGDALYNFSTLPGDKDHLLKLKDGTLLCDIPGTCVNCGPCFHECYAVNAAKRYAKTVIKNWGENTLLLRAGVIFGMLDAYISEKNKKFTETGDPKDLVVKMFRINTSGEIENLGEFVEWNKLAKKHKMVKFGVYTKNFQMLEDFLATGDTIADNLCVNVSAWKHNCDEFIARHPGIFNIFEYDPTELKGGRDGMSDEEIRRYQKTFHCLAVTAEGHHRDGITCDKCGRCYGKCGKGLHTMVYAH